MNNYVLIYHFPDKKEDNDFRSYLEKEFPKHKVDENDRFCYFGFSGRNQAEVEDKITDILNNFGIGSKEYVALYYTKPDRPDLINRTMLLGKDELLETDLQHISKDRHMTFVEDLLDAEYVNR